jgi:hypothetical protein
MSKKQIYYRQCRLHKTNNDGASLEQTSYIPEPYCTVGKVLKLKDADGKWDDGWVVTLAHPERRLAEDLPDPHNDIKHHRLATGDSERKAK